MRWVAEVVGWELGELPHLDEEEKVRYKEQIKVREERRRAAEEEEL